MQRRGKADDRGMAAGALSGAGASLWYRGSKSQANTISAITSQKTSSALLTPYLLHHNVIADVVRPPTASGLPHETGIVLFHEIRPGNLRSITVS